jgi:predicted nucleic acid-binding protein
MAFVVDASVSLAWCLSDETTAWTRNLLDRLIQMENASVPAHWRTETVNGLLMAVRRNRIKMSDVASQIGDLRRAALDEGVDLL